MQFIKRNLNRVSVWLTPRSVRWLVIYAVVWLMLGMVASRALEDQIIRALGESTGELVTSMLTHDFSPEMFNQVFSPEVTSKLDQEFEDHRLNANNIEMIKIFNLEGKVLYSSKHAEIGQSENEDLQHIRKMERALFSTNGKFSVFIPVKVGDQLQQVGFFEIYMATDNLVVLLKQIRFVNWAFIISSAVLVLSALSVLIKRATYTIETKTEVLENLNQRLKESNAFLERANSGTVAALLTALDAKDHYTAKHSSNVATYALQIGKQLGLSSHDLESIETAAILHDIGKIGIPEQILNKRGSLSGAEFSLIKKHPEIGAQITKFVYFLEEVGEIILCHHERFDGGGYPAGLSGKQIPIGARILALADFYDAITTDRPYRFAMSEDKARRVLKAGRDSQFDPIVVDAFLKILEKDIPA